MLSYAFLKKEILTCLVLHTLVAMSEKWRWVSLLGSVEQQRKVLSLFGDVRPQEIIRKVQQIAEPFIYAKRLSEHFS